MTFCYIARMEERRWWLRRARRILSVWLLKCIICNLDKKVMQVPRFNHIRYNNHATVIQVRPTWGVVVTDFVSNQSWPSRAVPFLPFLHFLPHRHLPFSSFNPRALASLPWRSLPPLAVAKSCQSAVLFI
jgi:hypothetical protein